MQKTVFQQLTENIGNPVYLITQENFTRTVIVKLESGKGKPAYRKHIITDNRCSCNAFFHAGDCKHLKMIASTYEGSGVTRSLAIAELIRVSQIISGKEITQEQREELEYKLPDKLGAIALDVPRENTGVTCLLGIRIFTSGSLVVRVNFLN